MSNQQPSGREIRAQIQNDVRSLNDRTTALENQNHRLASNLADAMELVCQLRAGSTGYTRNTGGRNSDQSVNIYIII